MKNSRTNQIDFDYNAEIRGKVQYFDFNGNLVIEYPMIELHLWLSKEEYPLDNRYLDDNWVKLSTEFYNFKNPSKHIAKNTQQETNRDLK